MGNFYLYSENEVTKRQHVQSRKGQDQKPFKVSSFTAITSARLDVSLHTLSGRYLNSVVGGKEKKKKQNTQTSVIL